MKKYAYQLLVNFVGYVLIFTLLTFVIHLIYFIWIFDEDIFFSNGNITEKMEELERYYLIIAFGRIGIFVLLIVLTLFYKKWIERIYGLIALALLVIVYFYFFYGSLLMIFQKKYLQTLPNIVQLILTFVFIIGAYLVYTRFIRKSIKRHSQNPTEE